MVGVILAAGDGNRLKNSAGEERCKVLEKVNNMNLIEFALNNLISAGVTNAFVVVGKYAEQIKAAVGDEYKELKVTYVYQSSQKGLINAFMHALRRIETDEDVILQLADEILFGFDAEAVENAVKDNCDFCCGITHESDSEKIKANFSVETDENMIVKSCEEKPAFVKNNIKGTGFCVFKKKAIKILKNIYDEDNNTPNDLCDYINYLVSENITGKIFCVAEREFNINTFSDLKEATTFYA